MESQQELMGILYVEDADSGDVVKKIDNNGWKKIVETIAACKKWLKQTKYGEILISLLKDHHPAFGYHCSCYKKLNAILKALSSNSSSPEESSVKTN